MANKPIDPETGNFIIRLTEIVIAFFSGIFGRKKRKKKPTEEQPK